MGSRYVLSRRHKGDGEGKRGVGGFLCVLSARLACSFGMDPRAGVGMDTSIVIPVRNEAPNVAALADEIMETPGTGDMRFEILFVDDHSTDDTAAIVEAVSRKHPCVKIHTLDQERGKDAALMCGMGHSEGDTVITMDGDGQNDPRDIIPLLDALQDCDMVCGIRRDRKASLEKRASSWIANRVRNAITGDSIEDAGCAFRVMRRPCAAWLVRLNPKLFGTAHCFYPTLARGHGFTVRQVRVRDRARQYGRSKFAVVQGRVVSGMRGCLRVRRMVRRKGGVGWELCGCVGKEGPRTRTRAEDESSGK